MNIEKAIEASSLYQKVMTQPPEWADDKIIGINQGLSHHLSPYLKTHYRTSNGSVNVFCVDGAVAGHPACELTWLEFLRQGSRMPGNLQKLAENPGYYHSTEPRGMHLESHDGQQWFVGNDGLHRIAIARFMFNDGGQHYLHGVGLDQFVYDWKLFHIHQLIMDALKERKVGCVTSITRSGTPSAFEDGPGGWSVATFEPQLEVEEDCMPRRAFTGDEADIYLKEITGRNKRRWFKAWRF